VYDLGEFYTDLFETAMEHDEMVLEVQVPPMPRRLACAYKKFNLLQNDMGVIGVATKVTLMQVEPLPTRGIVLGNAGVTPIRAKSAEAILIGKKPDDAIFAAAGEAAGFRCRPRVRHSCFRRLQASPD